MEIALSKEILGRIFNGAGKPIDGLGDIYADQYADINGQDVYKRQVKFALTLEKAANACNVNFIGGYSALVQKGFSAGDKELIESIPRALAVTDHVCCLLYTSRCV